jgi:hypothetical protein
MSKAAAVKRRAASRVDMPQRAALESAFPLVLGAAQTRVPVAAVPRMQMQVLASENPQKNCAEKMGSVGLAYWGGVSC